MSCYRINGRKLSEIARVSRPDLKVLFVIGYAENATFRGDFLDAGMDMLTKASDSSAQGLDHAGAVRR